MMATTTKFLAFLGLVATLSACETLGGAGQDIETAGETIQRESNEAQY